MEKRIRIAALQYANGKVKECNGLNEALHSFFYRFSNEEDRLQKPYERGLSDSFLLLKPMYSKIAFFFNSKSILHNNNLQTIR